MVRRDFIQRLTAGAAAGRAVAATTKRQSSAVTFQIKGFTCITCALGLEVMMKGFRGVTDAKASYPEGKAVIAYDPGVTSEEALRAFIDKATGFKVTKAV